MYALKYLSYERYVSMMLHKRGLSGKQAGFTLIELASVLAIAGVIASYAIGYKQQQIMDERADVAVEDIKALRQAYRRFYSETLRDPNNINELAPYYTRSFTSPFNTTYSGTVTANGYQISLDTDDNRFAHRVNRKMSATTRAGDTVSVVTPVPSIATIAAQQLHRVQVDGRPELNQMQTHIDANGFNVSDIGELNVSNVDVTSLTVTTSIETPVLEVSETIEFGDNSIRSDGTNLIIDAGNVNVNGALSVNGNINANGNSLENVGVLSASNVTTGDMRVTGTAVVDQLDFDVQTFDTLTINNELSVTQELSTTNLTILENGVLSANLGEFNNITVEGQTVTGTAVIGSTLTVNGDATVSGRLTADRVEANSGSIDTLTGNSLTYTQGNFGNLNASDVIAAGVTANVVQAAIVNATNINLEGTITAVTGEFNSILATDITATEAYLDTVVAHSVLANTVNTDELKAKDAEITGSTVSNGVKASTAEFDTAIARTVDATSITGENMTLTGSTTIEDTLTVFNSIDGQSAARILDFASVASTNYTGGSYTATGDFSTSSRGYDGANNSVNTNEGRLAAIRQLLEQCDAAGGCLGINLD